MKTEKHNQHRSKAEILADIASLPLHIHGGITEDKRKLASGKTAVYYNFQCKSKGKNICFRIPAEKVEAFKKAVGNGARADELMAELSDANLSELLSDVSPLKKNFSGSC